MTHFLYVSKGTRLNIATEISDLWYNLAVLKGNQLYSSQKVMEGNVTSQIRLLKFHLLKANKQANKNSRTMCQKSSANSQTVVTPHIQIQELLRVADLRLESVSQNVMSRSEVV